jgi:hypothetical protein
MISIDDWWECCSPYFSQMILCWGLGNPCWEFGLNCCWEFESKSWDKTFDFDGEKKKYNRIIRRDLYQHEAIFAPKLWEFENKKWKCWSPNSVITWKHQLNR